jgi:hypothetical protein
MVMATAARLTIIYSSEATQSSLRYFRVPSLLLVDRLQFYPQLMPARELLGPAQPEGDAFETEHNVDGPQFRALPLADGT